MKEIYSAEFCEEGLFHIYNRTNNKEALFLSDDDRYLFMKRYQYYLAGFLETYCWCLIPNHFHFVVKVRSREEICLYLSRAKPEDLKEIELKYLNGEESIEHLIELEWNRFLISYSMRFNLRHNRAGNLFYRSFKRVAIEDVSQLRDVIVYVHTNPCKHRICKEIETFEWSSYRALLNPGSENSIQEKIFSAFGGMESFKLAHVEKMKILFGS